MDNLTPIPQATDLQIAYKDEPNVPVNLKDISFAVNTFFDINDQGLAIIKDEKIVINNGSKDIIIRGLFAQAIRENATKVKVTDSHNLPYNHEIRHGCEFNQVGIIIENLADHQFEVEKKASRSLIFEYEVPGFARKLYSDSVPNLVITGRFGNCTYHHGNVNYNLNYKISKPTLKGWQQFFYHIVLAKDPVEMQEDLRSKDSISVSYTFGADATHVKRIFILVQFAMKKWMLQAIIGLATSLLAGILLLLFI